MIYTCFS